MDGRMKRMLAAIRYLWEEKAMKPTRRRFVQGGLAAGALTAVPARLRAQQAPPAARTIRAVLHGDLRVSIRSGRRRT